MILYEKKISMANLVVTQSVSSRQLLEFLSMKDVWKKLYMNLKQVGLKQQLHNLDLDCQGIFQEYTKNCVMLQLYA